MFQILKYQEISWKNIIKPFTFANRNNYANKKKYSTTGFFDYDCVNK